MAFQMDLLVTQVISICSLITGVSAVVLIIFQIVKKAKAPNDLQNTRISKCENDIFEIQTMLAKDNKRFDKVEDGNRIIQRCMLALLAHGIDGNEIESMRKAKEELQNYLINQ